MCKRTITGWLPRHSMHFLDEVGAGTRCVDLWGITIGEHDRICWNSVSGRHEKNVLLSARLDPGSARLLVS